VLCRRQCSAQAIDLEPVPHDTVSIGCPLLLSFFVSVVAIKAHSFTGDVSVRVQNPELPHLVPCSYDGRHCLGSAGATFASAMDILSMIFLYTNFR
jgi:hypothetical protein